jgi:hypothetical protein
MMLGLAHAFATAMAFRCRRRRGKYAPKAVIPTLGWVMSFLPW